MLLSLSRDLAFSILRSYNTLINTIIIVSSSSSTEFCMILRNFLLFYTYILQLSISFLCFFSTFTFLLSIHLVFHFHFHSWKVSKVLSASLCSDAHNWLFDVLTFSFSFHLYIHVLIYFLSTFTFPHTNSTIICSFMKSIKSIISISM